MNLAKITILLAVFKLTFLCFLASANTVSSQTACAIALMQQEPTPEGIYSTEQVAAFKEILRLRIEEVGFPPEQNISRWFHYTNEGHTLECLQGKAYSSLVPLWEILRSAHEYLATRGIESEVINIKDEDDESGASVSRWVLQIIPNEKSKFNHYANVLAKTRGVMVIHDPALTRNQGFFRPSIGAYITPRTDQVDAPILHGVDVSSVGMANPGVPNNFHETRHIKTAWEVSNNVINESAGSAQSNPQENPEEVEALPGTHKTYAYRIGFDEMRGYHINLIHWIKEAIREATDERRIKSVRSSPINFVMISNAYISGMSSTQTAIGISERIRLITSQVMENLNCPASSCPEPELKITISPGGIVMAKMNLGTYFVEIPLPLSSGPADPSNLIYFKNHFSTLSRIAPSFEALFQFCFDKLENFREGFRQKVMGKISYDIEAVLAEAQAIPRALRRMISVHEILASDVPLTAEHYERRYQQELEKLKQM